MKKKSEEKEKLGGYQNVQDTTRKPYFDFNQVGSSPTTPPTGVMRMFTKTDGSADVTFPSSSESYTALVMSPEPVAPPTVVSTP